MDTFALFAVAKLFENRRSIGEGFSKNIYADLDRTIQSFLDIWAHRIPESALKLYKERLQRPKRYIQNRKIHENIVWLTDATKEISAIYKTDGKEDLVIIITPKHILVRDSEFNNKEILFPFVFAE